MLENLTGLDPAANPTGAGAALLLPRSALRVLVVAAIVALSAACPDFDRVMAFAGSALCFTVCVALPLLFHLKMFARRLSPARRVAEGALLVVAVAMAVAGTVCAVVPRDALPGVSGGGGGK